VILINLLPHREATRKRKKLAFFAGMAAAAVAGLLVVGAWFGVVGQLTSSQQDRNAYLSAEIGKLDVQIKDIAALKGEIESLKSRQKAVEDLQTDRNVPVHILNELVKQTPEGVYYTNVKQTNQVLSITGVAQTNERVSELLRNTANNSEWLMKPELIEIKVSSIQSTDRTLKRLFDFSMRLDVKRPQDPVVVAAAASASGAAPAASGVKPPAPPAAKKG
jgi:type IV pilus assembly protein PilN